MLSGSATRALWAVQDELVQIYMDRGLEEDLARRVRHMPQAALLHVRGISLLAHRVGRRRREIWHAWLQGIASG